MILGVFLAPHARVSGSNRADFQNCACKSARFSTANLHNFGAERARKPREKRADSFQRLSTPCHALLRFRGCFCRRWARVTCKNCAETRRKLSRPQPKIAVYECKISRHKASLSLRKPAHLVQRTLRDHRCLSCASCARQRPQSRRFSKFCMQNRAFFDRNFAHFRCRTCAQDAKEAR